jgi:hypothetical protein
MIKINLIPIHVRNRENNRITLILFLTILFFSFIVLFFYYLASSHNKKLNLQTRTLQMQIDLVSRAINHEQLRKQQYDDLRSLQRLVSNNHKQLKKALDFLKELKLLPFKIFIKNIIYQPPYLILNGSMPLESEFFQLKQILSKKYADMKWNFSKKNCDDTSFDLSKNLET